MPGYVELAVSVAAYAAGIVAQSVAARRALRTGARGNLGLLGRLAGDPLYLLGFAGQVTGFAFAFLARAQLPLFLVQAAACGAVGLATVFGALVLRWRVRAVEVAMLVVLATGISLLASAASPAVARDIPTTAGLLLLGLPLLAGLALTRGGRTSSTTALATLAGTAFAVLAISSRSLADEPLSGLPLNPLAWLVLLAAVLGQACLASALARGSATATVAIMDSVTMVATSVVGLAVLGDRTVPGREWAVGVGLTLAVAGVLVLGLSARPGTTSTPATSATREPV
ncbi:hypothetical protein BLA60_10000 [Actinophytocola xinjiangensis]|uniref:Magnesium transporter NIPA n=1 Tax=Actinophytocola xinjiangensis TaxID=485602 RepID=A0A7Z0WPH2_9PSEU|nr:hypothetical protein [Actinophytocola xinjiangensis]OLF12303.1 hypothetical protein BLA60_10000 [Actinophytocola xinjiangensis]